MLESYFTSLKYSDDLTREGKVSVSIGWFIIQNYMKIQKSIKGFDVSFQVYVKDEPPRKKDESTSTKVKIPVSNVTNLNNVASISDGNTILPSAIQILTDTEGNRVTQYKVQVCF